MNSSSNVDNVRAPSDEGDALMKLLVELDRCKIAWCLLGDTREYPHLIPGDVDIAVEPAALLRLGGILKSFCRMNGTRLVQLLEHESTARYFVMNWFHPETQAHFLCLDFCSDYLRQGQLLLTAQELLQHRVPALDECNQPKGFPVPAPEIGFIYYLLKKTEKQSLLPGHEAFLSSLWRLRPSKAREQIHRFWPPAEAERITAAADSEDWGKVRNRLPQLRRALRQQRRFSFGAWFRETIRRVRRFLRPTGFMVAVLGPDGSGKSTVISRCSKDLLPAFRRVRNYHLRPRLGSTNPQASSPNTDPHGQPPRGVLTSIFKLGFLWFDYNLGYWTKVRPQLVRSTLVVFDRYYHDLLVDPRRYRFASPMLLAGFIGRLVPKPDLWLLLDAPAEVLRGRKQEVSMEETSRQLEAYRKLVRPFLNCSVIDATAPSEKVASDCSKAVLDRLSDRLTRRLNEVK